MAFRVRCSCCHASTAWVHYLLILGVLCLELHFRNHHAVRDVVVALINFGRDDVALSLLDRPREHNRRGWSLRARLLEARRQHGSVLSKLGLLVVVRHRERRRLLDHFGQLLIDPSLLALFELPVVRLVLDRDQLVACVGNCLSH